VSEWTRENAWVFANVGRSIPPAGKDICQKLEEESLNDWRQRLFDADPADNHTNPRLLADLESFAKHRITQLLSRAERNSEDGTVRRIGLSTIRLNTSATLEVSRAKGGAYTYYMGAAKERKGPPPVIPEPDYLEHPSPRACATAQKPHGQYLGQPATAGGWYNAHRVGPDEPTLPPGTPSIVSSVVLPYLARDIALEEYRKWREGQRPTLPMRPLVLPERGQKFRIATISPAFAVVLGQQLNGMLLKLLKSSSVHSHTLLGLQGVPKNIKKGLVASGHRKDFILTSADLSAASDWIRHDVAAAVFRGIAAALGERLPAIYHDLGLTLLGRMHMEGEPDMVTSRGILMGLPLTWPILSLLNEFAGLEATKDRQRREGGKLTVAYSSCGDDFVAAWTRAEQLYYYRTLTALGLKLNEHKTYESKLGAVFVEDLYTISREWHASAPKGAETNHAGVTVWEYFPTQLKAMLGPQKEESRLYLKLRLVPRPKLSAVLLAKSSGRDRRDDTIPKYLTLPKILHTELEMCAEPWRRKALMALALDAHKTTIGRMRSSGVPLFWPNSLGGWGLPGEQNAPAEYRKAAAVILNGQDHIQSKFQRIFTLARVPQHLRKVLSRQIPIVEHLPERLTPQAVPEKRTEVLSQVVRRTMTFHSFDPFHDKRASTEVSRIDQIAKLVRRLVKTTANEWPSAKPMGPSQAMKLHQHHEEVMVDSSEIDRILFYTGTPDQYQFTLDTGLPNTDTDDEQPSSPTLRNPEIHQTTTGDAWGDEVTVEERHALTSAPRLPSQDLETWESRSVSALKDSSPAGEVKANAIKRSPYDLRRKSVQETKDETVEAPSSVSPPKPKGQGVRKRIFRRFRQKSKGSTSDDVESQPTSGSPTENRGT
jgi:hypothetical protein